MLIINEIIYYILFGIAKRMNVDEIESILMNIQNFMSSFDNDFLYNFISFKFCEWLHFIVEEIQLRNLSQNILEKVTTLI